MSNPSSVPQESCWQPGSRSFLEVVNISDEEKERLLPDDAAPYDLIQEANILLAQMHQFHTLTAQEFDLKNTAIFHAPFRLLYDSSTSHHTRWLCSFIALSYCWHNDQWTPTEGFHRMKEWPISSYMVLGMLSERIAPQEGIWIDQCCIDQKDEVEKRHAISSMDMIYKNARKVVIVLEDVSLDSVEEGLLWAVILDGQIYGLDLHLLSILLIRILSARWFTRAWCCHELQLSPNHVFLIPAPARTAKLLRMTPDILKSLYLGTRDFIADHPDMKAMMTKADLSYNLLHRGPMLKYQLLRQRSLWGRSLMSEFARIFDLRCSVEADQISIALNVTGLQLRFKGHTKSRDECRWILSMIALSAGDVTVLGGIDRTLVLGNGPQSTSWLKWSIDVEDSMVMANGSRLPECSTVALIFPSNITMDLIMLNHYHVYLPSEESIEWARALLSNFWWGSGERRLTFGLSRWNSTENTCCRPRSSLAP